MRLFLLIYKLAKSMKLAAKNKRTRYAEARIAPDQSWYTSYLNTEKIRRRNYRAKKQIPVVISSDEMMAEIVSGSLSIASFDEDGALKHRFVAKGELKNWVGNFDSAGNLNPTLGVEFDDDSQDELLFNDAVLLPSSSSSSSSPSSSSSMLVIMRMRIRMLMI